VASLRVLQAVNEWVLRREGDMTRDDPKYGAPESRAKDGVMGPAGVSVGDIAGAGTFGCDRETVRSCAFCKGAVIGADDGLLMAAIPQTSGEGQQRLLAAAPGGFGVNVGDG
jgi:hypothetical protein